MWILGVIILLLFLLYLVFRSPKVQTYLTQEISNTLNKSTGLKINIGGVDITSKSKLKLEDVFISDHHLDTLIYLKSLSGNVEKYNVSKLHFSIGSIKLSDGKFYLKKYKNEEQLNIAVVLDSLLNRQKDTSKTNISIFCDHLELKNIQFKLNDENVDKTLEGIDYNHLFVNDLNADFTGISIINDSINCSINQLFFKDHSGFDLKHLSGGVFFTPKKIEIVNTSLQTNISEINGDIKMHFKQFNDFSSFIDKVHLNLDLCETKVSFNDIGYFTDELKGVDTDLLVDGLLVGTISNLRAKNVMIEYGNSTVLSGNFVITGLPKIEQTFMMLDNIHLTSTKNDIENLPRPPFNEKHTIELPQNVYAMGLMNFSGNFSGFLNDFAVDGNLNTAIGNLKADIRFLLDTISNESKYNGNLSLSNFNMGEFYKSQDLGLLSFNGSIEGTGLSIDDAIVDVKAIVDAAEIKGYQYNDVKVEGKIAKEFFDGTLIMKDNNVDLDFYGSIDLSKKMPEYYFDAKLTNTNLRAINLSLKERDEKLSMNIKTSLTGKSIDDLNGIIKINGLNYVAEKDSFLIDTLSFYAKSNKAGYHHLELHSNIADATLQGYFKKDELLKSTEGILHQILPSYFPNEKEYSKQVFDYNLVLHNTSKISELVIPEIDFKKPLSLSGHFSSEENRFNTLLKCNEAKIYGVNYYNMNVLCNAFNDTLYFNSNTSSVAKDSVTIDNVLFNGVLANDNLQYNLSWKNNDTLGFYGNFNGLFRVNDSSSFEINIKEGIFAVYNNEWKISDNNLIVIDTNAIIVKKFFFEHQNQRMGVYGSVSERKRDTMNVYFNDLNLSHFEPLLSQYGINVKGVVNGKASVTDVHKNIVFNSAIDFDSLNINGDSLGQGKIYAIWNKNDKSIHLDGNLGDIVAFKGKYFPDKEDENIDAELIVNKLDIQFIEELSGGALTDVKGVLNGDLLLKGNVSSPVISGELMLKGGSLRVDYLNTTYKFSEETVIIEPDWIGFDIIEIIDKDGNKALATGTIIHENFSDMNFDINIAPNHFLCLNTNANQNPEYYGTAYVTGFVNVSGYADQLMMDINVKTEKGTNFYIPLEGSKEVSEIEYIKFVSKSDTLQSDDQYKVDLSGIQMNFDLDITQETEVQIIFDEKTGDVIRARGNGDISMKINTSGKFNIYGTYQVVEGDYLFTLQNLLNKKFTLEPGGTISWNGDPYSGNINMRAVYGVRAPLRDLAIPGIDTTGKRVPVDCYLGLTNNILSPDIEFDVNLPSLRADDNSMIKSAIKNNEAMNKEVFSLLLLNRFIPVTQGGGIGGGNVGGKSSSEVLSNQLSNWLSKISDDFDVGVNYRAGDDVSSREVEVALSTQLFNDRVSVETNLGVAGNDGSNTSGSNLAGDFEIEYKISKDGKLRGKVYNESNDVTDITANSAKYTQGAGIFYQEEFNSFKEFFGKLFGRKDD